MYKCTDGMYEHTDGHMDIQMDTAISEHPEGCTEIHTDILTLHIPAQEAKIVRLHLTCM